MSQKTGEFLLWAVINFDGQIMYSRGGSSSVRRLMVYSSEAKAKAALNNYWIRQAIPDQNKVSIKCIYEAGPMRYNVSHDSDKNQNT
jgi:hypothetical protein